MARKSTRTSTDLDAWQSFRRRHQSSPWLDVNPLYALPEPLIEVIAEGLPGLWTEAEKDFEYDLARTAGGGFFHRRPLYCPFLPRPTTPELDQAGRDLDELIELEMKGQGLSDLQVRRHREGELKLRQDADLRTLAYAGWLVTDPEFAAERDRYRSAWEERVAAAGHFPAVRLAVLGEELGGPVGREEAELLGFYRRWGLRTFLTWDVPVPMRPQVGQLLVPDAGSLGGAGLVLFLPWHLLRDDRFSLKDLARRLRAVHNPGHLDGWFMHAAAPKNSFGYKRLKNVFILRWCANLALGGRYGGRLAGHRQRLDAVFGRYLGVSPDSVKKLRLGVNQG